MLTIDRCKKILSQYGDNEITDEEIKLLKSLLEEWAGIEFEAEDECIKLCQEKEQSSILE
jgi:hypothetical protein